MRTALPAFLVAMALAWPAVAGRSGSSAFDGEQGMAMFDSGKLLATGGVSQLEGAGGGGLTTWALISGYGTRDGLGANGHFTYIGVGNYSLWTEGAAIGLFDRVELSYAYQSFDTQDVGAKLGLGKNFTSIRTSSAPRSRSGATPSTTRTPCCRRSPPVVQYKHNDKGWLISAIGGKSADGTDFYVAATKLFLAQSLLVDATLRETKANQFGFLGFGGDKNDSYSTEFEGSAAYLLSRNFAIGGEYRTKPDNLGIAREDDAWDLFAAYFLNKNLSLTIAYVDPRKHRDRRSSARRLCVAAAGL